MKKWKLTVETVKDRRNQGLGPGRTYEDTYFNTKKEAIKELNLMFKYDIALQEEQLKKGEYKWDFYTRSIEVSKYDSEYDFWDEVLYKVSEDSDELFTQRKY